MSRLCFKPFKLRKSKFEGSFKVSQNTSQSWVVNQPLMKPRRVTLRFRSKQKQAFFVCLFFPIGGCFVPLEGLREILRRLNWPSDQGDSQSPPSDGKCLKTCALKCLCGSWTPDRTVFPPPPPPVGVWTGCFRDAWHSARGAMSGSNWLSGVGDLVPSSLRPGLPALLRMPEASCADPSRSLVNLPSLFLHPNKHGNANE